jgi:site-specific DNA recombinase
MRFFVYCRKSTDREDRQILSTEAQKRLLLEHAQRQGFSVVAIYVENQSAYKAGRPQFNEMLQRLERGEADGILTYHLTRLARNSYDGGRLIYMMDEGTIQQIATHEKAYVNSADDKFMMQIHFAMAKKSSDDTSQFVRRDVESKLLRGEYPGKVPPGYLNITRAGHIAASQSTTEKEDMLRALGRPLRREEIDPIDGTIVRRLFEEAATGTYTFTALRQLSGRLGLRARTTGKPLSKNGLSMILANPYYYGAITYNGVVYDDALIRERTGNPEAGIRHEPLISRTLFERVQAAMFGRKKGRLRRHRFPFGGCILRCGECGCPVTAERQKGHVYYHCTGNRMPCTQKRWTREEALDAQFSSLLARFRLPPVFLEYAFARLRTVHAEEARLADASRRSLQGQLNAAQQKLDGLLHLKLSPLNRSGELLSDEEYLRQKRALQRDLDLLQEQLETIQQQGMTWIDDCEAFFHFTQRLVPKFTQGGVEEKKTLLLLICSNLTLTDQKVAAVYQEPYASLAGFELAGKLEEFPSEPRKVASVSEKVLTLVSWQHLLTLVRTYRLPPETRRFAA